MRLFRYASYFPDLPGHTSTINHFASELREWHTKALSIYEDLGYALHGYTEWQGKAQEEFVSTVMAERGQMDALCEGLSRAYQAVEAFAGVCYNQYWEVVDIRYRAEQLDAYYDGLSWSEAWEQSSAIDAQFALLKALYGDVKARRAEAEADCAAVLREALHVEPVDIRKPDDADQSPFNASELRAMSQGTLDSLAEEIARLPPAVHHCAGEHRGLLLPGLHRGVRADTAGPRLPLLAGESPPGRRGRGRWLPGHDARDAARPQPIGGGHGFRV